MDAFMPLYLPAVVFSIPYLGSRYKLESATAELTDEAKLLYVDTCIGRRIWIFGCLALLGLAFFLAPSYYLPIFSIEVVVIVIADLVSVLRSELPKPFKESYLFSSLLNIVGIVLAIIVFVAFNKPAA